MSQGACTNYCKNNGANYAITADGSTCHCSNQSPPDSAKVDDAKCDKPCMGYPFEMCGGAAGQSLATVLLIGSSINGNGAGNPGNTGNTNPPSTPDSPSQGSGSSGVKNTKVGEVNADSTDANTFKDAAIVTTAAVLSPTPIPVATSATTTTTTPTVSPTPIIALPPSTSPTEPTSIFSPASIPTSADTVATKGPTVTPVVDGKKGISVNNGGSPSSTGNNNHEDSENGHGGEKKESG
ncbi:hypothetical protein BGW38_005639, partial [Lunasporangiospora selenospora]